MKPIKYTVVIIGVLLLLSQVHGSKSKGSKKKGSNKSGESNESSSESSTEHSKDKSKTDSSSSSKSTRSTLGQGDELQYHPGGGSKGGYDRNGGGGGWSPPDYGAPHSPHLSGGPSPPTPPKGGQSNGGSGWPMVGTQIGFDLGGPGGYSSIIEKGCIVVGIGLLIVILIACVASARGGSNHGGWESNKKIGKKSDDDYPSDSNNPDHVQLLVKVNEAIEKKFR